MWDDGAAVCACVQVWRCGEGGPEGRQLLLHTVQLLGVCAAGQHGVPQVVQHAVKVDAGDALAGEQGAVGAGEVLELCGGGRTGNRTVAGKRIGSLD
jgi:hypothetical protein